MIQYPIAYQLTPTGSQTVFTLPSEPALAANLLVLFNSTVQVGNWSLSGTTLTLSWTPAADDDLWVYYTTAATPASFSGSVGGIRFDPEVIALALFVRLAAADFPFVTIDRRGKIWSNVDSIAQPYMALIETGGSGVQDYAIGPEKWKMRFQVLVYIRADANPSTVPATQINAAWKAIADVMNSSPLGNKNTLGGIVNNAWIDGECVIDTGILDQQCALLIPISCETGV